MQVRTVPACHKKPHSQTAACTNRLLRRLEELLTWARMEFKVSKSLSLLIRKGRRNDSISFSVNGRAASLGRVYTADLANMASTIMAQLSEVLGKMDQRNLPGKLKAWL